MTEKITPERAAMLRREAAHLCGIKDFDPPGQWPQALSIQALSVLMAGGYRDAKAAAYKQWYGRIHGAISDGLEAERKVITKTPRPLTVRTDGMMTFAGMTAPIIATIPGKARTITKYLVCREAFASWLIAIDEEPTEHVRAWLGDVYQSPNTEQAASRAADPCAPT